MREVRSIWAVAGVVLSACGGGGGDEARMQEGLYLGRSPNASINLAREETVLVLDKQETWVAAGARGHGTFEHTGPGPFFTASNALVAFLGPELREQPMTIEVQGDGSILRPIAPAYSAAGIPTLRLATPATGYDYDKPARLEDIAGTWGWSSVTISSAGTLAGTNLGCTLAGTLAPRPGGKNVFNAAFTLSDCDRAGAYTGVAVTFLDGPEYKVPTLRLMGINESRTRMNVQSIPPLL